MQTQSARGAFSSFICAAASDCLLGESPVWDSARSRLWWLDLLRPRLLWHDPASGASSECATQVRLTALAPVAGGRFAACGDAGFGLLDPDTGAFEPLTAVEGGAPGVRFNDGKADAAGRFWAGTMEPDGEAPVGRLHRFDPDGRATCVLEELRIPNGPAFDGAGVMYLADSAQGVIRRFPADRPVCEASGEVFATFADGQGSPDGMTCDDEDHLWVACWDGWCVRRFSPDGHVVGELATPVQRPTSCSFGGPDRATLFVTSARVGLEPEALEAQPLAGALLSARPGVCGPGPASYGGVGSAGRPS